MNPVAERLIPRPLNLEMGKGVCPARTLREIMLSADFPDAEKTLAKKLDRCFRIDQVIEKSSVVKQLPEEGYELHIAENRMEISAADHAGLLNACKTLRQLAETRHGGEIVFPALKIEDRPARKFRGIHICVFPETTLTELEKNLRLAAYHKFNYAVIEFWGNFPFESHPELGWKDRRLNRNELKRILSVCRENGLIPIPQFNILGHAAAARAISGKHAFLYRHPEYAELFEPTYWSWCISNPAVLSLLKDLVQELHDFFGNPPYFHLGCDEAEDLATCCNCREKPLPELLGKYLHEFHEMFSARNTRIIMWHDMLLLRDDLRWKNFVANSKRPEMQNFYQTLPRDVMIADWEYGIMQEEKRGPGWPVSDFFRENGFETLLCPWDNESDMRSMSLHPFNGALSGMLITTWHSLSDLKYTSFLTAGAYALWNPADNPGTTLMGRLATGRHLLEIASDMNLKTYEDCGYSQYQIPLLRHPHPLY